MPAKRKTWLSANKHLILAGVWALLVIPTILWWKDSVLWVLIISLYANFASELATHHAKKGREESNGDYSP